MKEIKGKSILVRVSARFELATVRVIGSRLYFYSGIRSIERTLKRIPRATRGGGGGGGSHTNATGTFFVSLTGRIEILGPVSRKIR